MTKIECCREPRGLVGAACDHCGGTVQPEPTEYMSKLTIQGLKTLADQLQQDACAVYDIIRRAEDGEISPDEAEAELKEKGIAIF